MFKLYSSNILYTSVLNFTQDSSFLLRSFRQLVTDLNTPIVWLFWGIMFMVILDIAHQLSGGVSKYGYLVGKVMIEAFFYSLFFAIWTDVFNKKNIKDHVSLVNKTRKLLNIRMYISQPKFIISSYLFINNMTIIYYASIYVCIISTVTTICVYMHVSKIILSCSLNNSHVYINNTKHNEPIDAIIKWEYSNVSKKQDSNNWILVQ